MKKWLLLSAAIVAEVVGTMSLRAVVDNAIWAPAVATSYIAAFVLLGLTLRSGLTIGVTYSIWGASGVALTALLAALLFNELLQPVSIAGIALIAAGVIMIESGSHSAATRVSKESLS
ncbi:DMT family transporter [Haloglycomyces albus]|uniref:DMT family transporter n=1 Tax=Haloglycomyces albus TaxID=526067 RepID=UPI00046D95D6|nr:SMR family transporter [Haloglycomyces albus]